MTIENPDIFGKRLSELKESIYEFVSEADYGEISDLDSYWSSITTCLIDYINCIPSQKEIHYKDDSLLPPLNELKDKHDAELLEKLITTTKTIEESVYNSGSAGYLNSDDLSKVQSNIFDFESFFEQVLRSYDDM